MKRNELYQITLKNRDSYILLRKKLKFPFLSYNIYGELKLVIENRNMIEKLVLYTS